jgi:hypothetical protein
MPVTCTLPRIAPPSSNTTASAPRGPAVARTVPAGVSMVRLGLVMGCGSLGVDSVTWGGRTSASDALAGSGLPVLPLGLGEDGKALVGYSCGGLWRRRLSRSVRETSLPHGHSP